MRGEGGRQPPPLHFMGNIPVITFNADILVSNRMISKIQNYKVDNILKRFNISVNFEE